MEFFLRKKEKAPEAKIASLKVAPGMTPEMLDTFTKDSDAVVLTVYATGTSPEILNEVIKKRTNEGKPVFLVSDNPGDTAGILKVTYGTQEESKNSGAIALEKVNVNSLDLLDTVIKDEFSKGKRGVELGEAVRGKFAFQDDEPKPIPDWGNPDKIEEHEKIYRQTLQRPMMGLSGEELEEAIRKWRGENLPVVNFKNPLKLVRIDTEKAFFQDSTGKYWYMDIKEQSWRALDKMDFHPMDLQSSMPIEAERSNFENIEDAVNYTQRLYFECVMENDLGNAEYFLSTENENKEQQAAIFQESASRCKTIVELMKKYEVATKNNDRTDLMNQIKSEIAAYKEFNGGKL